MSEPENDAATRVLTALVEARTGQRLSPARSWRIAASLKPVLKDEGIATLDLLVGRLASGREAALAAKVVDALLNNETSFFRDAALFEQLDGDALETLRSARATERRLRIWSAACSTGQEAYSLAIMLREGGMRWNGWSFDILATDVSATALLRARGSLQPLRNPARLAGPHDAALVPRGRRAVGRRPRAAPRHPVRDARSP